MLPDLPQLKDELFEVQMRFLRFASKQEMGVFSKCKHHPLYEGNMHGVERPTGEKEINSLWQISMETTFEPSTDTIDTVFSKLYDMATQAGNQVEKKSFEYLNKTLDEAGQTVSGKDKDLVDALFEMFEKVEIPLGDDGKLDQSGLQIVCGREIFSAMKNIEQTPEMKQRLDILMKAKEEKARAKEANRKLVG